MAWTLALSKTFLSDYFTAVPGQQETDLARSALVVRITPLFRSVKDVMRPVSKVTVHVGHICEHRGDRLRVGAGAIVKVECLSIYFLHFAIPHVNVSY